MGIAERIRSRFANSTHRLMKRRPLSVTVGFFVVAALVGVACSDQLPTEVLQPAINAPGLNLSANEGTRIGTDKQDYYLGETVQIEGWDWTPGETVRLQVVHVDELGDNTRPEHQPWEVVVGEDGHFQASWEIALDGDEDGATLKLTADGLTSEAHAEVIFTDLTGTVNLFSDVARTIAQNAFQWNTTVYPRIRSPGANTCYRLTWTSPSAVVTKTYHETGNPAGTNADPAGMAVLEESGTWSLLVDQRAAGTCNSSNDVGFGSATNTIFFDVARRVIIGAGTPTTTDAATDGGDQCVYEINNVGTVCQNSASTTMFVRPLNDRIRSYVKFDMADVSPAIPAGVIVTAAKVRLTVAGTAARTYTIQGADAAWAEGTVTWAAQPGVTGPTDAVPMASALVLGAGGGDPQTWVKWTVTADVQGYLDGGDNHGWRISDLGTASATQGRFYTTENTGGCAAGVTTCKRTWPVLLIDYTDPPKLVFTTTAKTGVVGACLGPIRVESREFDGTTPLVVTSDLTVDLSTDNLGVGDVFGTAGAGSFFSNGTCTTGTTSTTIPNGQSESNDFYYRATDRGDGGHDVVASATGYTPDPSQTQTINKAVTNIIYTGDIIIVPGTTFNASAQLSSTYDKCAYDGRSGGSTPYNRRVLFVFPAGENPTGAGGSLSSGFKFTNSSGVASATFATTTWLEGIYDMTVNAVDNDNCTAQKVVPDPVIAVLTPGNAATGGGFLAGSKVGGGRVNFGFNVRPIEGSDPVAYKGQLLVIRQDGGVPSFRCKGKIDFYGVVSGSDPLQNFATGTCDFQVWNPALNGGEGGWEVPYGAGYVNRPFIIEFIDNGSGKGKNAPPPDEFGFSISFVGAIADPSFARGTLNGGNIDVKTGGGTTTTGGDTGTGGTGGNGRKK